MRISRGGPPDNASTRPYATAAAVGCRPRDPSLSDAGGELCERRFLREASGNCVDARRNPIGEWDFFDHVTSRTRVDLAQLRKVIRWKPARRPDKSRPQPPMDKSDHALDQATHEDIVAVADRSRHREIS